MFNLLITLIVISCLLLILVVLAQKSKGGGLSSQFGGSGTQLMGVKRTGDLLEKLTWGTAIAILAFSMATNFYIDDAVATDGFSSPNIEAAQEKQVIPNLGTDAPSPIEGAASDSAGGGLEGL